MAKHLKTPNYLSSILAVTIAAALLAQSCSDENGDDRGSGGNDLDGITYGKIAITSSVLSSQGLQTVETASDCGFSLDNYRGEGSCLTPTSYIGHTRVLVGADESVTDGSIPEARLAAVQDLQSSEEGAVISGKEVDFGKSDSFKAFNELWDQYEYQHNFSHVSLSLNYQKAKFAINGKYVTMFLARYSQPFAESALLDSCQISDEIKSRSRFQEADILTGMTFTRGDYLFCVKDSANESCEATDFQWYDLDADQLTATRPSNPRTHAFLIFDQPTCTNEGDERLSFNSSPIRVGASLDTKFKLYADFSNGINSVQWKDSAVAFESAEENTIEEQDDFTKPFLLYYYKAESDQEVTEGTGLDMTYDFDTTDMIYFDGLDSQSLAAASLEQALKVVYTKHGWLFHKKGLDQVVGFGVEQYSSMTVNAQIKVTGDRTPPEEVTSSELR